MGKFLSKSIFPMAVDSMGGNTHLRAQSSGAHEIYKLIKPQTGKFGGQERGTLVECAAEAFQTGNTEALHLAIREGLLPYLYKEGDGEEIPVKYIVEQRHLKRKNKSQESLEDSFVYTDDGATRFCCWDVDRRAALGETALHICFLNNSRVHNFLAKEIINVFPNLIHDIYLGDLYYGESVLHMAIANEDTEMIRFLLNVDTAVKKINIEERCCGSFFTPKDQKASRKDRVDSEIISVTTTTDYQGLIYWGEHPLTFAACAHHMPAVRMLVKAGADLAAKDYNGNNILHMMVIHNDLKMFDEIFESNQEDGKNIGLELLLDTNNQGYTPLTLAAKLANKELFDHMMQVRKNIEWVFGEVECATFPLDDVDTINPNNGTVNPNSALSIILASKSKDHLDMLDGLLYQLLHEKWKHYGKRKFYIDALIYFFHLVFFIVAWALRPVPEYSFDPADLLAGDLNPTLIDKCYLLKPKGDPAQIIRLVSEVLTVVSVIYFIVCICIDIYRESTASGRWSAGLVTFLWSLRKAPMTALFIISCICVLLIIPVRFVCSYEGEFILVTFAIVFTFPYMLFFFRGFKTVGPSVLAIYTIVKNDFFRWFVVYAVFCVGFSQAMMIIFVSVNNQYFNIPMESIMSMLLITFGEFGTFYDSFENAEENGQYAYDRNVYTSSKETIAKFIFVVYIVFVTLLMINALIAMMGQTFNEIAATKWEWQRQWALIVLVLEITVAPARRLEKQKRYSQPDSEGKRRFVVRNITRLKSSSSKE